MTNVASRCSSHALVHTKLQTHITAAGAAKKEMYGREPIKNIDPKYTSQHFLVVDRNTIEKPYKNGSVLGFMLVVHQWMFKL